MPHIIIYFRRVFCAVFCMDFRFLRESRREFLPLNSFYRWFALAALGALAFGLTFLVFPFAQWELHFFQAAVFSSAFLFGPLAGAAVGIVSSAYTGLYVIHNPWIIGGNAILGLAVAYFYTRMHPVKAALAAFAVQLPYLLLTDIYLASTPLSFEAGIVFTLFVECIICGFAAWKIADAARPYLAKN